MGEGGEKGETERSVSQSEPLPHKEGAGEQDGVQDPQAAQQLLLGPPHQPGVATLHSTLQYSRYAHVSRSLLDRSRSPTEQEHDKISNLLDLKLN